MWAAIASPIDERCVRQAQPTQVDLSGSALARPQVESWCRIIANTAGSATTTPATIAAASE
jgi:hypothetical protein